MPISTKLFNEQTIRSFGVMTDRAAELQKQVSTGKKDVRPSEDTAGAAQLSATKELRSNISRYQTNLDNSKNRLDLSDSTLSGAQNIMTRLVELSVQAANGTLGPNDRKAIKLEVEQVRQALMAVVNTRDSQGQALFGGYRTNQTPFVQSENGSIIYNGDDGQTRIKVSDSQTLDTGIDGNTAFMGIETSQGTQSVFDIIDNFMSALDTAGQTASRAQTTGGAALTFGLTVEPVSHSFTISGPKGSAIISASLVNGVMTPMIDAINAATETTGITATIGANSNGILLSAPDSTDPVELRNYQIGDPQSRTGQTSTPMNVKSLKDGVAFGTGVKLADAESGLAPSISQIRAGLDHLALQRTKIGAYAASADMQTEVLAQRALFIEKTVDKLESADLAAVITELQSLLTTKNAAQQVFAKIGQQSLFDFIR